LPNNELQSFHYAGKADFFFPTDLPGKVDSSLLFFASSKS